jgi:RimJ/RimL family protein N-acetyltransferase
MLVREVRWSDFDDLREIYYELYEERDRGEAIGITLFTVRPSLADEVEWFTGEYRRVQAGDAVMSVAEDGGRVVGNCSIHRQGPSASSESGHVGVLGILVQRDHRGAGVGSALLTHALAACRGRFEVVRLSVFATNPRAQRLYSRFGFVPVGRIPRAIRRGTEYIDEEEMVLLLPPAVQNP